MENRRVNFETPLNIERLSKIKRLLMNEPLTSEQLSTSLKISKPMLSILLKTFGHNIHVAGWIVSKNAVIPKYFWGMRKNVPRPNRISIHAPKTVQQPEAAEANVCDAADFKSNAGYTFKPQPARRDSSVFMLFGDAIAVINNDSK